MTAGTAPIEPRAVAAGAVAALLVTVPAAVLGERGMDAGAGDDPSNAVFVWFALVLAGFVLGGYVAGRLAPVAPYSNGAVAAVVGYGLVQGVGLVLVLARGDDVRPLQLAFNALVAYGSGLAGGWLALRRDARLGGERRP